MEIDRQDRPPSVEPPPNARFRWIRLTLWLPAAMLDGAAVAWLASQAQEHWAPLVVFPLLVGCVLGMTLAGLMRLVQVGHRPTLLAGTLLAAGIAAAGQHFAAYRAAVHLDQKDAATLQLAREAFGDQVRGTLPAPPAGMLDFLAREAARGRPIWGDRVARGAVAWLSWAVDGLLVAAGALAVVIPAWRQPYCDRCRSWFSTTRRGPLDAATTAALAGDLGITVPDRLLQGRYRMVTCSAGCAAAGFEISWQQPDGKWGSATRWLDAESRNEIVRRLDAAAKA